MAKSPLSLAKSLIIAALDKSVVPFVRYVRDGTRPRYSLLDELDRRTAQECADYVQQHMTRSLQFWRREGLWDHALGKADKDGLFSEFGVWSGYSINYFADRIEQTIYGFDSFEGLREEWAGWMWPKGSFARDNTLPAVRPNVKLIKGWFDQSVPQFLATTDRTMSFVHVDCDTGEATEELLGVLGSRIRVGTVLVFDEYFGYRGWKSGEYRAWQDFVAANGVTYQYLGFSVEQVSLVVIGIAGPRGPT